MTQNIFSAKDQSELNSLIHHDNDCAGDCDWCSKFHRAFALVHAVTANITLTRNEKTVPVGGHFLAWCESCSDGENTNFWDACDWAQRHAGNRHPH